MPTAASSSSTIEFKDVELARQKYYVKSQETSKKRWKCILITCAILFSLEILLLFIGPFKQSNFFATSFTFLIILIISVIMFEAIFVSIIVLLATHKDSGIIAKYRIDYERAYKGFFIHRQLAKLFTDLHYDHTLGLNKNILESSGLIYTGDIYKSNDLVVAKYKNTNFTQADVEIIEKRERRDSDGNTEVYYVTVFKGRYLVFEFPKKFDFKMVVSYGSPGINYINPKTGRELSRIETESPDFNKRFLVYAEDGFEAFYILNPDFLYKLEQLGEKYENALSLYFSNNKLYVGLNDNNDAFEPPNPTEPLNEKTETERVINDMKLITDLVDNLKLSK